VVRINAAIESIARDWRNKVAENSKMALRCCHTALAR
jgi:hypothetical protein